MIGLTLRVVSNGRERRATTIALLCGCFFVAGPGSADAQENATQNEQEVSRPSTSRRIEPYQRTIVIRQVPLTTESESDMKGGNRFGDVLPPELSVPEGGAMTFYRFSPIKDGTQYSFVPTMIPGELYPDFPDLFIPPNFGGDEFPPWPPTGNLCQGICVKVGHAKLLILLGLAQSASGEETVYTESDIAKLFILEGLEKEDASNPADAVLQQSATACDGLCIELDDPTRKSLQILATRTSTDSTLISDSDIATLFVLDGLENQN